MQPKVSVIIPVYNIEKYLRQCLESACTQTLEEIQVIAVDDGSTDGSAAICRELMEKYPGKLEYYHKENGGSASARNLGLEHARGEYIGFIDSDDWVEPDMYEKMYQSALRHNADTVMCRSFEDECPGSYEYIFPRPGYFSCEDMQKEIIPYLMPGVTQKGNFRNIRWCNWLRIYRRSIIERHRIRSCEGVSNCEDLGFNTEFMLYARSGFYLDCRLYHNRPNPGSQSRNYVVNMWPRTRKLIDDMHRYIDPQNDAQLSRAFDMCIFYFCTMILRNESRSKDRDQQYRMVDMMLQDPECCRALSAVSPEGMNREYSSLYSAMRSGSAEKALRCVKYIAWRKRVLYPAVGKLLESKVIGGIYRKLRNG